MLTYEPMPIWPEWTAVVAAESVLVVSITLPGILPTGEPRIRPKIVIVHGELAGMGAPVGGAL